MNQVYCLTAGIVAAWLALASQASAQPSYPSKPIRLVVPYAPGGSFDIAARLLAEQMSKTLGQAVIVDNRTGAGGQIGANEVAKAPADGYNLLFTPSNALMPLTRDRPFSVRDFATVAVIGSAPLVLVVPAKSPARSVRELVDAGRARPGSLKYGTVGIGSYPHLTAGAFVYSAKLQTTHIPYKDYSASLGDLAGGQIDLSFAPQRSVMQQIQGGTLRALAVAADRRLAGLPDVPTLAEAGVPGVTGLAVGVFASAATPSAIITKVREAVASALGVPNVQSRLIADAGILPGSGSSEAVSRRPKELSDCASGTCQCIGQPPDTCTAACCPNE